jgi:hypothetical protein
LCNIQSAAEPVLIDKARIRSTKNENSLIYFVRRTSPVSRIKITVPIVLAQHKGQEKSLR